MIERVAVPDPAWTAVDHFIDASLLGDDRVLAATLAANAAAGLPDIDVSPAQGQMLHLFARMARARRILEIGTLGGYSTICLARALPDDGMMVTLEIDPHHAAVACANIDAAGLADRVEVRVGTALALLDAMVAAGEGPFDLVFIDADKENGAQYVCAAMALGRPGTTIIVDNVVREGGVLDPASDDPRIIGTRALFEMVGAKPRLSATAVQTVGAKKWDGFLLAIVGPPA
ncbi:O-methyltransferase [Sphingomonas sp. 28-63-12]|uniref:O-methyltransferase n=1 Tax=Sphingomonas sp. 28-63-12 TaxID=1970434 RepID=UPI000BC4C53B|nr:MAG: methyltransferase [Sphingomonas sp. 28-63-12]